MSGVDVPGSCRWTCKSVVAFVTFEMASSGGRRWHSCQEGGCEVVKLTNTRKRHATSLFSTPIPLSTSRNIHQGHIPMPTTRSKTRGTPENSPSKNPPAPAPKSSKRSSVKPPKNPEAARSSGANLLQTLLEEKEKELSEALGGDGHGDHTGDRTGGHGHCRGNAHGRGRGGHSGDSSRATTPEIEGRGASEVDDLDTRVSLLVLASSTHSHLTRNLVIYKHLPWMRCKLTRKSR